MKLNTPLIIFDLECTSNQVVAEVRPEHQTNDYIIDIGCALVVQDTYGNFIIQDTFASLVKPEQPITPFIENLTHISNDMVKNQKLFPEVAKDFEQWVQHNIPNVKNVRLMAWGSYFDINVLRQAYGKYNVKYPFSGTAFCAKTLAAFYYGLAGKSMKDLSVGSCAKDLGIIPKGQYHRAETDAIATAEIVIKCLNDLSAGFFVETKKGQPYTYLTINKGE